ncbi:hypothetical protein VTN02DRAFT_400 [Thermoascus thermophilus]
MSSPDLITTYGFTAVPASASALLTSTPAYPPPSAPAPYIPVSETPVPDTPLAQRIQAYARERLPEPTYNHCLRVYHYGLAIKRYRFPFPAWGFTDETFFLACMLHDIGTTEASQRATRLSFEFHGGLRALEVLRRRPEAGETAMEADAVGAVGGIAPTEQAESVAEAIIRHQDLCEGGKITAVGQLLQLATIFDNTGTHAHLIHPSTIADVSKHCPRQQWSDCFAATIRRENSLKPWAHTTALGEEAFPNRVLGNTLMAPYE